MTAWLGLDIGTSSVKAVAVRDDGKLVASARSSYDTSRPGPGIAEQDPADYLRAAAQAIEGLGIDTAEIGGVGLSGHTPTAVFIDEAGHPVRAAMTWQDSRAIEQAEVLAASAGKPEDLFGTALAWSPAAIPAKLLWLSQHEPQTVAATRRVLQPKDYLGFALTGEATSDPWSSKGLCNVLTGQAAAAFLEQVGWRASICPPIAPAWQTRGRVTAAAASRFGLPAGIPVAVGWSDALAAMLRVGAFTVPSAFILTGTSDIVGQSYPDVAPSAPGLMTIPRACAPLAVTYGPTQSSGDAVEWLAGVLGKSVEDLMLLEAGLPEEPPVFVPYLRGERAPLWNPRVRAGFSAICAEHRAGDLVEAVLQGITLGARQILDVAGTGASAEVHVAGVSATVQRWIDARLQTLGRPLVLHDEANASAVGAAVLGAVVAGVPLGEAVNRVSRTAFRVAPSASAVKRAASRYAAFTRLSEFTLAENAQR